MNVQMDTGEGKTYAVAMACVVLLKQYRQVLVLTVNQYLAERDRERVEPYLSFLGIKVVNGLPPAEFVGVSYLTSDELLSGYLNRTRRAPRSSLGEYPHEAAMIIDEIDSALIDADPLCALVTYVQFKDSRWGDIFEITADWGPAEFERNPINNRITLQPEAVRQLHSLATGLALPGDRLVNMTVASLWARNAMAGREYEVSGNHIRLINQTTGSSYTSYTDDRARALHHLVFSEAPPVARITARVSLLSLLGSHPVVVGCSGTASYDLLYYAQLFRTPTVTVPPKFPRFQSDPPTWLSLSRADTFNFIAEWAKSNPERPLIVAAHSQAEAIAATQALRERVEGRRINALTVFDHERTAAAIEYAGDCGVITIMNQGAARGVDIRSANNPMLMVLGHTREPRLDRQILGRVGRHGERFEAAFIVDPIDPLVLIFNATSQKIFRWAVNSAAGEELPSSRQMSRNLDKAQRQCWEADSARRQLSSALDDAKWNLEESISEVYAEFRSMVEASGIGEYVSKIGVNPSDKAVKYAEEALARRDQMDDPVRAFLEAVEVMPTDIRGRSSWQLVAAGRSTDADELASLAAWLRDVAGWLDQADGGVISGPTAYQVHLATDRRFWVESMPTWRSAEDCIAKVLGLANAAVIEQLNYELVSLETQESPATYWRKAALVCEGIESGWSRDAKGRVLDQLSRIDRLGELDGLFPKEFKLSAESVRTYAAQASKPVTSLSLDAELDADINARICAAVANLRSSGFPMDERTAILYATRLVKPMRSSLMSQDERHLRMRINSELTKFAMAGVSRRDCRVFEDLAVAVINDLALHGLCRSSVPRQHGLGPRVRQVASYVRTIPLQALFGLVVTAVLLLIGIAIPGAAPPQWVSSLVAVTGYGWITTNTGGTIVTALTLLWFLVNLLPNVDERIMLTTVGPLVSYGVATAVAFPQLGALALLTGLGWWLWAALLMAARRLVKDSLGADTLAFAVSVSAVGYVISHVAGLNWPSIVVGLWFLLASAAVITRIRIPILRSAKKTQTSGAEAFDFLSTELVLSVDPRLTSAVFAVPVAAFLAVDSIPVVQVFVIVQCVAFATLVRFRFDPRRVETILARRNLIAAEPDKLRSSLTLQTRWATLLPVSLGIVISVCVSLWPAARPTLELLLIAELVALVARYGWNSFELLVSARSQPITVIVDTGRSGQKMWSEFMDLCRSLRRRYWWFGALVIVVGLLDRVSAALDMGNLLGMAWDFLIRLVGIR
jgi:preprotein translocase subunit SecA